VLCKYRKYLKMMYFPSGLPSKPKVTRQGSTSFLDTSNTYKSNKEGNVVTFPHLSSLLLSGLLWFYA